MKTIFLLATFALAQSVMASSPQIHSLEFSFRHFVEVSRGQDLDTQLKNWELIVESQAPDLYLRLIANNDANQIDASREKLAATVFPFLLNNSEAILKQFEIFNSQGVPAIQKLASSYPGVDFSQIEVWAIPSLNKLNGQVATINGRIRVMFGMDMIEQIRQKPDFIQGAILVNNLPVLMAHEFTHALHYVMSDFGQSDSTTASFWGPLWDEGLAQVNSQLLIPGTDLSNVLMELNLKDQCNQTNIRSWAAQYILDSKLDESKMDDAYSRWFLMSSGLTEHGVYRAGYCLGYSVILSALQTYSMKELLQMNRARAYQIGQMILGEFAK